MQHLARQVRGVDEGFMWISYDPDKGYSFQTLRRGNRSGPQHFAEAMSMSSGELGPPGKVWKKKRWKFPALLAGVGASLAVIIFVIAVAMMDVPTAETRFIEDSQVPLYSYAGGQEAESMDETALTEDGDRGEG